MKKIFYFLFLSVFIILITGCGVLQQQPILTNTVQSETIATEMPKEAIPEESQDETVKEPDPTQEPSLKKVSVEFPQRLEMAFGLFSLGIDEEENIEGNSKDFLSYEFYELKDQQIDIRANYAPLETYETTAYGNFNSMISFDFVLMDPEDYHQTTVMEETLENDVRVTWYIATSLNKKHLYFEAFTENYGYNFNFYTHTGTSNEKLIDMMYSFDYNEDIEMNLINQQQTKINGTFISTDNSLKIALNSEWNIMDMYLTPDHVLQLEWNQAETMIEVLRYDDVLSTDDIESVYDSLIENMVSQDMYAEPELGEKEIIEIENLGVDAYSTEVYTGGDNPIYIIEIGFVYGGYFYHGRFMWVERLDATKRTEMLEAIQAMAPNH